jgi:hypothetical protein
MKIIIKKGSDRKEKKKKLKIKMIFVFAHACLIGGNTEMPINENDALFW